MDRTSRKSETYNGSFNWGQSQPLKYDNVQDYLEAAYARRRAYRDVLDDFAKVAGSGITIIAPCIKSEESALRKLWDRTSSNVGKPEMIVDYLRARILVPANPGNLGQLAETMHQFMDPPLTVGYKDRIYRPNGSGFRALNGVMNINGLHAELQIIPDDWQGCTRIINEMTEGIRTTERATRMAEESPTFYPKMLYKAEASIAMFRKSRKALHDFAAAVTGVNALMDPALREEHKPPQPDVIPQIYRALSRDYFGRNLAERMKTSLLHVANVGMSMPRALLN